MHHGGWVEQFGNTEAVLAAYDLYTRERELEKNGGVASALADAAPGLASAPSVDSGAEGAVAGGAGQPDSQMAPKHAGRSPQPQPLGDAGGSACILSVDVAHLEDAQAGHPPVLQGQDLIVTIRARGRGNERPHIGFMIEQSKGVGITSLATHEDGAAPVQMSDGTWQSVLTFPDLPLHSGDYVISAFLFDETGLAVYDEWFQFLHFRFIFPKPLPGLVRLPHRWS